ncbi:MAG: hypothetical protein QF886_05115, partial [Planctomycetota bacterium]|nr:hypothetical protein [Planctomycetota bacterium]
MKRSDMRCSQRIAFALIFSALPGIPAKGEIADFEFSRLDGFEDASPWVKGDPNTDLQQKDAAVTTSREFFKEGKQSLAFLIRVNWTKRDNEQYAKGWPMMRRVFQKPRDWSEYDYLFFWVYAKTKAGLQQERVLRIGFPPPDTKSLRTWHTISGIRPNQWVQAAVPLTAALERKNIGGISFYVAEGWYEDGDKVDFFIDDMRLAKRT